MRNPAQPSLFDELPTDPKGLSVVDVLARDPADKAQTAFRRLVAKIERQREALRTWQEYLLRHNQRMASELEPLHEEFRRVRRKMAFLLDELLGQPNGLRGKKQRAKLQRMLVELSQGLLVEAADAELEALHDKHSAVPHAENLDEGMALSQALVEDVFGVNLGDEHGARSIDELFAEAQKRLREQADAAPQETPQSPRRKSRRTEAAEARREQAAKEVSQSVREVYRKLASALHPDRETDATLRQRKTEQMQRANRAYEAGDLLELLNLQLEIEQIDAAHLSSLPKQRLAHYSQVLRDQLAELEAEIDAVVQPFRLAMQVPPAFPLVPKMVDDSVSAEVVRLKRHIDETKADLVGFRDPKVLKQALQDYQPDDGMDELVELAMLAEILGPLDGKRTRKRRK